MDNDKSNLKVCDLTLKALSYVYKIQTYWQGLDEDCLHQLTEAMLALEHIQSQVCQGKVCTNKSIISQLKEE